MAGTSNAELVISYASRDGQRREFEGLLKDLRLLGRSEWHDDKLTGGLPWWTDILDRIARAQIIVVVLSKAYLRSVACQRELEWALSVNRKLLPVRIDLVDVPEVVRSVQALNYTDRHVDPDSASRCMARLAAAIAALEGAPDEPLPDPLPPAPEVPPEYGGVLTRYINAPLGRLSSADQRELVQVTRQLVGSEEGDHAELAKKLGEVLQRDDLTIETKASLESLREELAAETGDDGDSRSGDGKWKVHSLPAPRIDVWALGKHLQSWYETQGMRTKLSRPSADEVMVDCHSIGRARATGAGARLRLVLTKQGDMLEIAVGNPRWADKAASAGVGLAVTMMTGGVGFPALAPAAIGGYRQARIAKQTFKYVEQAIPLCNRGEVPA